VISEGATKIFIFFLGGGQTPKIPYVSHDLFSLLPKIYHKKVHLIIKSQI